MYGNVAQRTGGGPGQPFPSLHHYHSRAVVPTQLLMRKVMRVVLTSCRPFLYFYFAVPPLPPPRSAVPPRSGPLRHCFPFQRPGNQNREIGYTPSDCSLHVGCSRSNQNNRNKGKGRGGVMAATQIGIYGMRPGIGSPTLVHAHTPRMIKAEELRGSARPTVTALHRSATGRSAVTVPERG